MDMRLRLAAIAVAIVLLATACGTDRSDTGAPASGNSATSTSVPIPTVPPTKEPVSTATPAPWPTPEPLTARDLQEQFENWPEEHRIRINDDVVVLLAYEDGHTDWGGTAFIHHIPSISTIVIGFDGSVRQRDTKSDEARAAIEKVLSDESLMAYIASPLYDRGELVPTATPAPHSTPTLGPTGLGTFTELNIPLGIHTSEDMERQFENWPEGYRLRVNAEVVVLFAYPSPILDWAVAVLIQHIPSVSSVNIGFDGNTDHRDYRSDEAKAALEAVLADEALMTEIMARTEYPR